MQGGVRGRVIVLEAVGWVGVSAGVATRRCGQVWSPGHPPPHHNPFLPLTRPSQGTYHSQQKRLCYPFKESKHCGWGTEEAGWGEGVSDGVQSCGVGCQLVLPQKCLGSC